MEKVDSGRQIAREVPDDLKRLMKIIVRGFYPHKEDAVVVDYLLRNTIMNETELHELLKFDRKMLRIVLNRLKNEHFLKDRLRIETGKDGKTIKQIYYYINYKGFVNVVKYKLHQMQKRIESQERDDSCKAMYVCSNDTCSRTYTEFDIDKLADLSSIDPMTGEARLICTFCGRDVNEKQVEQNDARQVLINFNSQMEPVYKILRDIEHITLSPEILEPKLANEEANDIGGGVSSAMNSDIPGNEKKVITVDVADSGNLDVEKAPKEMPAWMQHTSIGSNIVSDQFQRQSDSSPVKSSNDSNHKFSRASATQKTAALDEDHIKKTLMHHENKTLSHVNMSAVVTNKQKNQQVQAMINGVEVSKDDKSADGSETSDSESDSEGRDHKGAASNMRLEDELMSSEEDDDYADDDVDMVTVNGAEYAFDDVTEEQIAQMSAEEREIYAKVGQKRFSAFVD